MAPKDFTRGLTQEQLKAILEYNQDTGVFSKLNQNCLKKDYGHTRYDGYRLITINRKSYRAHRLAWLYVYGILPDCDIDHIDGDPSNNKISNLRLATRTQNTQNSKTPKHNSSGVKGVYYHKRDKAYEARIQHNGKRIFIGRYGDIDLAKAAYENAAKDLFGSFHRQQ